jgi:hypothetical protein
LTKGMFKVIYGKYAHYEVGMSQRSNIPTIFNSQLYIGVIVSIAIVLGFCTVFLMK